MTKEKLEELAAEKSSPCVTISLNTHRTHPDNKQDGILLKNLVKEARARVIDEFGKRDVVDLLEKLDSLENEIDVSYNLESLHIFVSNSTKEIVKSTWATPLDKVQVAESFAIKPLIKLINRTEEYLILLLSQSGVKLFYAVNDEVLSEIKNDYFPFTKNPHFLTEAEKISDAKKVDNMVREYFQEIDKALIKVFNETGIKCIVICTENNFSRLMQVAGNPSVYIGRGKINYNDTSNKTIAGEGWEIVYGLQEQGRAEAIKEMQEAAGHGRVITKPEDIYKAAKEGRGELLIVHDDFKQAVIKRGEDLFYKVNDVTLRGVIDDITSEIAWEVLSKKGRVIFTKQEEIKKIGDIALKLRY